MALTDRAGERARKRDRLHALLDREGLDAIVMRAPHDVAWWSCGGRGHIAVGDPVAPAAIVVTRDSETVLTTATDAARMHDEELSALVGDGPGAGARLVVVPWELPVEAHLPTGDRVADDVPRYGTLDGRGLLEEARRSLTAEEAQRYRELCHDAAIAVTDATKELMAGLTEYAAAGVLSIALLDREIEPVVLAVAGASRVGRYRQPLPTIARLGPLAMLGVCGRRHGLHANLTRFVSFGPLDAELADAQIRLLQVEAAYFDALWPGQVVGETFRAGAATYRGVGFDPEEWHNDNQGGPCGYLRHDHLATAEDHSPVVVGQAFAWSPSVPSLRCEDTVLLTDAGLEVLTVDPRWPTVEVSRRMRPIVVER
jgi:Xaa-Pro aminopeptidase